MGLVLKRTTHYYISLRQHLITTVIMCIIIMCACVCVCVCAGVYMSMCICVCVCVVFSFVVVAVFCSMYVCMCVCARVCLPCMNELVALLNLTSFIYKATVQGASGWPPGLCCPHWALPCLMSRAACEVVRLYLKTATALPSLKCFRVWTTEINTSDLCGES